MNRLLTAILVAASALSTTACSDRTPTATRPQAPDSRSTSAAASSLAMKAQVATGLPLRGNGDGDITRQDFAPGFPTERSTFEGRCSVPSDYVVAFSAVGQLSHLGEVTLVFEHCSRMETNPETGEVTFTYGDGVLTFTVANGDELRGSYGDGTGEMLPDGTAVWRDHFVLDGGTGRFQNATGSGIDSGTTNIETGYTEWNVEGTIDYDASLRRRMR